MFKFAACTLLFWTVVPFLLPILTVLYIYRGCVILLQKIVHPNWVGIMSPRDMVIWEEMDKPNLKCSCYTIKILQGQVDLEKFQNEFMERVISYRNPKGEFSYAKFQHYFDNWMGFPFWKKEEQFDIKQHIRFLNPEKNQSQVMTKEELDKISGDLMTRPFQAKKSPWEILIVPNYQSKNGQHFEKSAFAVIIRFHHTLLDGFSFHKMLVERISGQNMSMETLKKAPSQPSRTNSRGFFSSLKRMLEILLNLGMFHAQFFFLDRDFNIWHGKGNKKLTGTVHTVKCEGIPFSVTRSVSKKLGVAPTATMFSCVAGGIRRYLEMEQAEIPEKMTAFFPWPVDNHPMEGLVNHWSFVDAILPVGEKDRVQRIRKANANFQALKNSPLPELIWDLSPFFSAIPTPFFNVLGWNRKSTLALTNFPGATTTLILFGKWKELETMGFLNSLRGNTAIQLVISTTCGNVNVAVTADRGMLSEEGAKQLTRCIQDEFKALEEL